MFPGMGPLWTSMLNIKYKHTKIRLKGQLPCETLAAWKIAGGRKALFKRRDAVLRGLKSGMRPFYKERRGPAATALS